ncbi:MAG: hypothetical protein QW137_09890 [Candidatus Caldarchaeum sp.]
MKTFFKVAVALLAALLPIILIIHLWNTYPTPPQQFEKKPDYALSVSSYDIELWRPYLERLGYKYCGTTVARGGVYYTSHVANYSYSCYSILKREKPTLAILYGKSILSFNGPANYSSFGAGNDNALRGLDIKPPFSSRITHNHITIGTVPVKSITIADRISIGSYLPDPGVQPYRFISGILVFYDVESVNNPRLPDWFHSLVQPNRVKQKTWITRLQEEMFIEMCGTYSIDPSNNRLTIKYDIAPTGALCYFLLNLPEGYRIQPLRIVLDLKAEPVTVTGRAYMVWEGPLILTASQVMEKLPRVPYNPDRRDDGQLVNMLLSGQPISMTLEIEKTAPTEFITVGGRDFQQIRNHYQPKKLDDNRTIVMPFLFAISTISEVDRIPTVHATIALEYVAEKVG